VFHQPLPPPIGGIAFFRPRYGDKKGKVEGGQPSLPLGPNSCIVDALASLADEKRPVVNPYDPEAVAAVTAQLLEAEVARLTKKWAPLLAGGRELRRGFLTQGLL